MLIDIVATRLSCAADVRVPRGVKYRKSIVSVDDAVPEEPDSSLRWRYTLARSHGIEQRSATVIRGGR